MIFVRKSHDIAGKFYCSVVEAQSNTCTGHEVFDKFTHPYDNHFVWIIRYVLPMLAVTDDWFYDDSHPYVDMGPWYSVVVIGHCQFQSHPRWISTSMCPPEPSLWTHLTERVLHMLPQWPCAKHTIFVVACTGCLCRSFRPPRMGMCSKAKAIQRLLFRI
jgi:hypothetical protein